ncbi:MAG: NAD(P)/FAD-dependent oxidoreductase [Acidobacteriota bacterium]
MRKVLADIPPETILHRTASMVLASPGCTVSVELRDPDLIVERAALTRWLLSKAQAAGAHIFLSCGFDGFVESSPGVQIRFQSSRGQKIALASDAIIGADGVSSDVAHEAGIPLPRCVPIVQAEVDLPCGWDPGVTQVWFNAEDTRFFYWLIPESAEKGVAGLVGDDGTQTNRRLRAFLNRHNLKAEAYQGAKVALHHPRLKPWGKIGSIPLLMVGDAAGQVKVTTVGGTVTGLQGAEAAVRSILNGTSYKAELRSVKGELNLHWFIRVLLDRLDSRGYDLLIGAVSPRLGEFLGRHNRDSMAPVFWRLPFVEPRLLQVALQGLASFASSRFHCLFRELEYLGRSASKMVKTIRD